MTTITVKVENEQNAILLEKMLRELSFVADIEIKNNNPTLVEETNGSYLKVKRAIDKIDSNSVLEAIKDPSEWQRSLRDEW